MTVTSSSCTTAIGAGARAGRGWSMTSVELEVKCSEDTDIRRAREIRRHSVAAQPQASACSRMKAITLVMCSIERQAELLGAAPQIVAAHRARERLVLHPLHHRRGLEVEDALRRPHERGGGDEARHLVAGVERVLEPRLARARRNSRRATGSRASPTRDSPSPSGSRRRGTDGSPGRASARSRSRAAARRAPVVFVFAELPRVAAHRGFDGRACACAGSRSACTRSISVQASSSR